MWSSIHSTLLARDLSLIGASSPISNVVRLRLFFLAFIITNGASIASKYSGNHNRSILQPRTDFRNSIPTEGGHFCPSSKLETTRSHSRQPSKQPAGELDPPTSSSYPRRATLEPVREHFPSTPRQSTTSSAFVWQPAKSTIAISRFVV